MYKKLKIFCNYFKLYKLQIFLQKLYLNHFQYRGSEIPNQLNL